jgi:outer membrane lipoprotein-sorting protein
MRARACVEIAAALAALLLSNAGLAQEPAWTLDQLMRALASREHAHAEFNEARYLRLLSRPVTLRGTLSYRAPDWLEKRTVSPNEEVLRVEGDRLSVDLPARRIHRQLQLQELPAVWGFVESIRATLRGDRAALQRVYRIELEGEVRRWVLTLHPVDAKMAEVITYVRLTGAGGRLSGVEIVEARGDRSVMKLREPQS